MFGMVWSICRSEFRGEGAFGLRWVRNAAKLYCGRSTSYTVARVMHWINLLFNIGLALFGCRELLRAAVEFVELCHHNFLVGMLLQW